MTKRPSLAETLRQIAVDPREEPLLHNKEEEGERKKPFYASTRVGKKKVTTTLSPADHKRLKRLSVETEKTTEALLQEAISDLFMKYGV